MRLGTEPECVPGRPTQAQSGDRAERMADTVAATKSGDSRRLNLKQFVVLLLQIESAGKSILILLLTDHESCHKNRCLVLAVAPPHMWPVSSLA